MFLFIGCVMFALICSMESRALAEPSLIQGPTRQPSITEITMKLRRENTDRTDVRRDVQAADIDSGFFYYPQPESGVYQRAVVRSKRSVKARKVEHVQRKVTKGNPFTVHRSGFFYYPGSALKPGNVTLNNKPSERRGRKVFRRHRG